MADIVFLRSHACIGGNVGAILSDFEGILRNSFHNVDAGKVSTGSFTVLGWCKPPASFFCSFHSLHYDVDIENRQVFLLRANIIVIICIPPMTSIFGLVSRSYQL